MKTALTSFVLSSLLFCCSCSGIRYIDIQVLNPAQITLPEKVGELVISDPRKQADKPSSGVVKNSRNVPYYDIVLDNFDSTLTENLRKSPYFSNVPVSVLMKSDSLDSVKVFSRKKEFVMLKVNFRVFLDTSYAIPKIIPGFFVFYYKFQFQLYDGLKKHTLDWSQVSNTFIFNKRYPGDDGTDGFRLISSNAAETYVKRIAPYWTTEERVLFYSGNRYMRKGYALFCKNDLEGAIEYWKKITVIGTRKLSSIAAHNIALCYEVLDDLDSSEKWLMESIRIKKHEPTDAYLNKIRARKLSKVFLDKQLM